MELFGYDHSKIDSKLFSSSKGKEVKLYRNGDTTNVYDIRIPKNYSFTELTEEIKKKLKLTQVKKLRLFNEEGVEIYQEDMQFIPDKSVLYVSKGEDFDPSSRLSEYQVIKELGQGGFGQVVLAINRKTKEKVAIKTVNGNVTNARFVDMVFAEADVLKALKHKHIVKLYQCYTMKNMNVVFIMEYLEGGELGKYLKTKGKFDENEAKFFFTQLADAIYYCHRERLIHRDLKLENILLTSLDTKIIKVVDFGIAGVSSNFNAESTQAGTLRYKAPEVITGKLRVINPALDIWSMGCILYQLLHGVPPFDGKTKSEIMEKISMAEYKIDPEIEKKTSRECIDLIKRMLDIDYKTRINIADIISHPWLTGTQLDIGSEEEEEEKISGISSPITKDDNAIELTKRKPHHTLLSRLTHGNSLSVKKQGDTKGKTSNLTLSNNNNNNNNNPNANLDDINNKDLNRPQRRCYMTLVGIEQRQNSCTNLSNTIQPRQKARMSTFINTTFNKGYLEKDNKNKVKS